MFETITGAIMGILASIGSLFVTEVHYPVQEWRIDQLSAQIEELEQEQEVFGAFNPAAGQTYRLQSSIGTTDTSITLSSFKEPVSNLPITMNSLASDIGYGTLDPQSSTRKEFISFTGVTQNSDGTATLTGVSRGLAFLSPFTASSTLRKAHPGQSIFILSDTPQLFEEYAARRSDEAITGAWTFPEPTSASNTATKNYVDTNVVFVTGNQTVAGDKTFTGTFTFATGTIASTTVSDGFYIGTTTQSNHLVNKAYVDSVALSGSADANQTTKGIAEEATNAEVIAGTESGGTGARLFINPASVTTMSQGFIYATTTSGQQPQRIVKGLSVDANDILMMWGHTSKPAGNSCAGGITGTLVVWQSSAGATTTLHTAGDEDDGSNTNGCSVSLGGGVTATTTGTVNIQITGTGSTNVLQVMRIKQ